jgi:integrase
MDKYKPTINLFLDKRIAKISGRFPIKLTVYCNLVKRRYSTEIDLSVDEWERVKSDRLKDERLREIKIGLTAIQAKANKIITDLRPFSFSQFEDAFFENSTVLGSLDLQSLFDAYIKNLEKHGSIGTAISYQTCINSLQNFRKKLSLHDITHRFLQEYETYMYQRSKSPSTVSIYLRHLRTIYNDAISKNLIVRESYPFGKNKYIMPVSRNIKKALSGEEIKKILSFVPAEKDQEQAIDFWILSYLCNGMNFCDIAHLKPANITPDFIYYLRSKTRNTRKASQTSISVPLHPRAKLIIDKWRCEDRNAAYTFPILSGDLSPRQMKYRIQGFIKRTNKQMAAVSKSLDITQSCNTYSCRHSFATILKRKNVSTEFISESLGHSSISTTALYLASFEDKTKIEYSQLLTDF